MLIPNQTKSRKPPSRVCCNVACAKTLKWTYDDDDDDRGYSCFAHFLQGRYRFSVLVTRTVLGPFTAL